MVLFAQNASAASYQITIQNGAGSGQSCSTFGTCFSVTNSLINTGDTLRWYNQDTVSHTIVSGKPSDTSTGTSFDSGIIKSGNTFQLTFPYSGAYSYFCVIHPWMTGSITVKYASAQTIPTQLSCSNGYFLGNDNLCHPYLSPILYLQTPTIAGLTVTFNGNSMPVSYGSQLSKITWDWGDGQSTVGWFSQSHTYSQGGTYTVKVTSYDTYGGSRWQTYTVTVKSYQQSYQPSTNQNFFHNIFHRPTKPVTTISSNTVNWYFSDSKGNKYHWSMPLVTYDSLIKQPIYIGTYALTLQNGQTVYTYDYRQFVKTIMANPDFVKVIDQVYSNAGSDDQFVYETWYIVSEMTTYNVDITNSNLWPIEVFTRGEGDCKDKSILIADMLRSSSHTKNWQITLKILDMDHPDNPVNVNHMMVFVDTGKTSYSIESTATSDNNGLNVWAGKTIFGWNVVA